MSANKVIANGAIVSIGLKQLKSLDLPMEVFKRGLPWDRRTVEGPALSPKPRIAVLPFSNISPDQSDEYVADGMTEELINTISEPSAQGHREDHRRWVQG